MIESQQLGMETIIGLTWFEVCVVRHGSGDIICGFKSQPWWSSFYIGFFCFFLLLYFLHHGSIQSVVGPVCSLFKVQHYCGMNCQPCKKAVEIKTSLQKEISMKKLCQCHLWGKNADTSAMLGPIEKSLSSQTLSAVSKSFLMTAVWYSSTERSSE